MRLIDMRSGGGLLLLAAALALGVAAWRVMPLLDRGGRPDPLGRTVGDGKDVATYGFDLSTSLVPAGDIVASGLARDAMPALDDPPVMPAAGVAEFNADHRGSYLVSDDRVIGVTIGGQSRAYPVRVLNWHEVVNDTLAGVPIAVTYHPLCDSAVVFDRRAGGRTRRFGVSGLLLDSNLLLFDRSDSGGGESLWSQLRADAIAGPAAADGLALEVLPASLATWRDWVQAQPDTTVLQPDETRYERYRSNTYGNYFLTGKLRFPVDPLAPAGGLPLMSRVLVLEDETRQRVLSLQGAGLAGLPAAARELGAGIRVAGDGSSILVEAGPGTRTFYSLWFAWYAAHPDSAEAALAGPVPRF